MPDLRDDLPSALRARAQWRRLGPSRIPALIVAAKTADDRPAPAVLWMHGRTARKEIDPGRALRFMRAGIAFCAVDLPGHGERFDAALQHPRHTLDLVLQMRDEIDEITEALAGVEGIDVARLGIGGMSAGGMATLSRLCAPHSFLATSVEATTGSWEHQRHREMFEGRTEDEIAPNDPIRNLDGWREIPVQALHARHDAWVALEGQQAFIDALRERSAHPETVELVVYDETGAPFEHAGFGRFASDAKSRQRDFFQAVLFESQA